MTVTRFGSDMEMTGAGKVHAAAASLVFVLMLAQVVFLLATPARVSAYTVHAPIYINGDANFTAGNGVTGGDGSPSNPYIISGWDIDSTASDGIVIRYATVHFVVRDVYVHSTTRAHSAVSLFNVKAGRVERLASGTNQYGVMVDSSSNVSVADSNITGGIYGIALVNSGGVVVSGNNITSGFRWAVSVQASTNVTITGNDMFQNGGGIFLQNSTTVIVEGNNVSWSNAWGVYAFTFGSPAGIDIRGNNLTRNGYGVYLENAAGVRVYHNNFLDNFVQAYDNRSTGNSWDLGCPGGGNYWSDYAGVDNFNCRTGLVGQDGFGDSPRVIDADSRDAYPLMTPWRGNESNFPPTLFLSSPASGDDWTGGSTHNVSWLMADDKDLTLHFWINYSLNGGADGYPFPIASGDFAVGSRVWPWRLPLVNSTSVEVIIVVIDGSSVKSTDRSRNFTIDSSPPDIYSSSPLDGSLNVDWAPDIQTVFTEVVNKSSAQIAFSVTPAVASGSFTWRTTQGRDVLNVSHSPLAPATQYTVSFSTALNDASNPGNHPPAALTFRFTTKPRPAPPPPVAHINATQAVGVGQAVKLDGSGSTGNITWFNWTIEDDQSNVVATLSGATVNYTFTAEGDYLVILNVTDASTGLSDVDSMTIGVILQRGPPGSSILPYIIVVIVMIAVVLTLSLIGGVERLHVPLMTALIGLAWRRKDEGKEETETRGMVRGYIQLNPGDTYTDIKTNLDLSSGSLTWHLMKLEKEEVIKSTVQGTRKRYYPAKMPIPKENGGQLHEIERRLLAAVKADPGKPVKVLAEELGMSSQLALYHLRKMDQKGLISMERRGLSLRVYPPPKKDT